MTSKSELTHPVYWTDVSGSGTDKKISATTEECRKLADRLGVISFSRVDAHFKVTRWHRDGLKVVVDIHADVAQSCVVSLETVSSSLNEQAEWYFKPEARPRKNDDPDVVLQIDPLGEDPADPLIDGKVDLGQLLVEHLCLMIDPFARSANVAFDTVYEEVRKSSDQEASNVSPFAVLKQIGKKP